MSTRIAVLSDSHGRLPDEVLPVLQSCSHILHAGDIDRLKILERLAVYGRLYAVRGNCDGAWAKHLRTALTFTIEQLQIQMAHEKRHLTPGEPGTALFISGHTHHYALTSDEKGRVFLNPGSCSMGRFGSEETMAVLTVDGSHFEIEKIILRPERPLFDPQKI